MKTNSFYHVVITIILVINTNLFSEDFKNCKSYATMINGILSATDNEPLSCKKTMQLSMRNEELGNIKKVLKNILPSLLLKTNHPDVTRTYFSLSKYIFELNEFPKLIFKAVLKHENDSLNSYIEHKTEALKIITTHNLNLLIIPSAKLIEVIDNKKNEWTIIIEEKADICPGFAFQRNLYAHAFEEFNNNQGALAFFQSLFKQLAFFISLTGFSDAHYNNIPLDNNGNGIILLDLDFDFSRENNAPLKGIVELLFSSHDQLFYTIIYTAANGLMQSPLQFMTSIAKYLKPSLSLDLYSEEKLFNYITSTINTRRKLHQLRFAGMAVLENFDHWWNQNSEDTLW